MDKTDNENKPIIIGVKSGRDEKGRFVEGNDSKGGRPEGTKNYLTLLEEALEAEAKKTGKTYWEKLAEWSFRNPTVAISILKKYLPDKTQSEITSPEGIKFIIERATEEADDNTENKDNKDL